MSDPKDFLPHAEAQTIADSVNAQFEVDPDIMQAYAYQKRLRTVPVDLAHKALVRADRMVKQVASDLDTRDHDLIRILLARLYEGMWQRLTADEQRAWLLKVE